MIRSFKQPYLETFWNTGKHKRIPSQLTDRLIRKLDMLNGARELRDLRSPPSNQLHPLYGDRKGQSAISVSGHWRLCFEFKDGDIFNIELVQYH